MGKCRECSQQPLVQHSDLMSHIQEHHGGVYNTDKDYIQKEIKEDVRQGEFSEKQIEEIKTRIEETKEVETDDEEIKLETEEDDVEMENIKKEIKEDIQKGEYSDKQIEEIKAELGE